MSQGRESVARNLKRGLGTLRHRQFFWEDRMSGFDHGREELRSQEVFEKQRAELQLSVPGADGDSRPLTFEDFEDVAPDTASGDAE